MRLVTFQDKSVLNALEDGIWYSTRDNRMKCIDYDYVDEEGHYPIYTFASTQLTTHFTFGLSWFYASACHLARFMQFDLEQRVMLELEVSEDFILSMKQHYWVKRDLSKGEVFTCDFLQHARKEGLEHELEALIPCIKKNILQP